MRTIVFQNLIITILAKLISFFLGLYIAKHLSENAYGTYLYVLLIIGYMQLLPLGVMNGFSILFPRTLVQKPDKAESLFSNYFIYSFILQLFIGSLFFILYLDVKKITLFYLFIIFLNTKFSEIALTYYSAKLSFYKVNAIKIISDFLYPLSGLLGFYFLQTVDSIFLGNALTTIPLVILIFALLKLKVHLPKINFSFFQDIKHLYVFGIYNFFTYSIDIFFRSSDRFFISQFYPLEDLAQYGFSSTLALGVWLLAVSYLTPYSQILAKEIAHKNWNRCLEIIVNTNKKLLFLTSFISVISAVCYPFVLTTFVHKYLNTTPIFCSLLIVAIFLSLNNIQIYYMTYTDNSKKILLFQVSVLIIQSLINLLISINKSPLIYFSFSSILTFGLYWFLSTKFVIKDLKEKILMQTNTITES